MKKIDDNFILRICGDGPEKENIRQLVKDLNLENRVVLEGRRNHNELPKFYKEIDYFAALDQNPSEIKASLQEALMCGTPCISGVLSTDDSFKCEEWGILVNPESEKSMVGGFGYLLGKKDQIEKLSQFSREFALRNFSTSSIRDNILKIYDLG
jgi:glycosyltransferase involved in cell wall biosynthesis